MIRIGDRYMIDADEHCFTVSDIMVRGENTKKPGEEYLRPISYHGTLTEALQSISRRMQRQIVSEKEQITLADAIRRMRDVESRIGRMIEGRTGGV
jgi:hypothetical protein